jgi:putative acetyltransferase
VLEVEVREERPDDIAAIRDVSRRATRQQEADLVDRLRANGAALLSLVATLNGQVVGHILYSPASVGTVRGAALGPMAVAPEYQRQGIGGKLVTIGNRMLADQGCPFVVVLGHAAYYPKFGFRPATTVGITSRWKVPDDVFMVAILDEDEMRGVSGQAHYRDEFSSVS